MGYKDHFGLDVGKSEIKVVYLGKNGASYKLISFGSIACPANTTVSGASVDQEQIAGVLTKLLKDLKIGTKNVVFSLPESKIFTRVIETPTLSEGELENAVKFEAEQFVPMPLTDVVLRHQIVGAAGGTTGKMEVLVIAAPNTVIDGYMGVANLVGLEVLGIESEMISIARSTLGTDKNTPTSMIINLGGTTTDISVVKFGSMAFVRSIAVGGDAITRAIVTELKFDVSQAEQYKRTYGIGPGAPDSKMAGIIKPIVDSISDETKRAIAYYQSKKPDDPIRRVVLAGGMASMPGLVSLLTEGLGLEVQIGNPLMSVGKTEQQSQQIADSLPNYSVAVGLALKDDV